MQERFKQLLEEKNLTATRFAAIIKVNASAMSHILNGRSKPGFDVLDKIAQAFPEVNLNWLISGKGSLYNNSVTSVKSHPIQQKLFEEEIQKKQTISVTTPAPIESEPPKEDIIPVSSKKIKRIILFFEDGSFEDYER